MYAGKIVERNTAAEIFANPKHDYTKKLLAAIPKIDEKLVSAWRLPEGRKA
jgi:oligopeptide/dipeptide ABC transporter ATP-binding protein